MWTSALCGEYGQESTRRRKAAIGAAFALAVSGLAVWPLPAGGQEKPDPAVEPSPADIENLEKQKLEGRSRLEKVTGDIELSADRRASLEKEIAAIRKDQASLRTALVQTAKTQKKLADDISEIESRLAVLSHRQEGIEQSLKERRGLLAEVLAALQRMGRNPPPAVLISPNDALASVRSAILLGAVVPEIRDETVKLVADLQELSTIRASIANEHEQLLATLEDQAAEEEKLELLLTEKDRIADRNTAKLEEERQRAEQLASKAGTLQDLIASLETEIESAKQAAEAARLAEARRVEEADRRRRKLRERTAAMEPDANRIEPAYAFSSLKNKLEFPVAGNLVTGWNEDDGTGFPLKGMLFETSLGALVTTPADGWVVYAGAFRSYGQLLILNVGEDYDLVLAGMSRIDVAIGQFVVAGEPVGRMKSGRLASAAALALASGAPTLYIEFRKDGEPIDPAPWWADNPSKRVSNDS